MYIEFYEKSDGTKPVLDFIESLDVKLQTKTIGVIVLLKEKGHLLGMPFSKKLDNNIFELRVIFSTNHVRILYFFDNNNKAVLTNCFIKKTNRVPRKEIDKANRYRDVYVSRKERI